MKAAVKKLSSLSFFILVIFGICISGQQFFPRSGIAGALQVMNKISEDTSTISLRNITITIVYDNNPCQAGLSAAWGFACLIKGTEKTILFDTGGNATLLLANMNKMGIHPKEVERIVLSHAHHDHIGGLEGFLQENKDVTVYFPASFPARFKALLTNYGVQAVEIQDPAPICKNVYSTGQLGLWIKEQALIIHTDKGIILITGCAHPGIEEMVKTAQNLVRDNLLLVMGGFHLAGTSESVIAQIVSNMKKWGVRYAGPCHCSGDLARRLFKNEFGNTYIDVGVGKIIKLE